LVAIDVYCVVVRNVANGGAQPVLIYGVIGQSGAGPKAWSRKDTRFTPIWAAAPRSSRRIWVCRPCGHMGCLTGPLRCIVSRQVSRPQSRTDWTPVQPVPQHVPPIIVLTPVQQGAQLLLPRQLTRLFRSKHSRQSSMDPSRPP
jgi:hypothetical protein